VTGRRDDLVGGGLKRSQGKRENREYESFDERVLGGGAFVDSLKDDFRLRAKMKSAVTLTQLLAIVATALTIEPDSIRKPSKSRGPAAARGVICHLAIYELGYTGREVGKFLHLGPTGVSLAARRGEKILKADSMLLKKTMDAIDK
jgi:chromosomal replication initiation ATPase DnaA